MAHEIRQHDKVVLHRTQAWHGLGIVVQDAPTPVEALRLADLDWEVSQWPLYATDGEGNRIAVEDSVLNVRSDTRTELGIVGAGWQPIQNRALAEFCAALAQQGDRVLIESAGSIRKGRKVWFLIKGESFSVRGADEVTPYLCANCGHDGCTALRLTPTTVRVVCSNTLHLVIPDYDPADRLPRQACYVVRHCGKIDQKIQEARAALELYGQSLAAMRERIDVLSGRDVNSSQVQQFFLDLYPDRPGGNDQLGGLCRWEKRRTAIDPRGGPNGGHVTDLAVVGAAPVVTPRTVARNTANTGMRSRRNCE